MPNSENKGIRKVCAYLMPIVVAALIIWAAISVYDVEPYKNIHVLDENWNVKINGKNHDDVTLTEFSFSPLRRGDKISLTTTMPEVECEQPYMQLRVWNSTIKVLLDDEELYTFGQGAYENGTVVGGGNRWFSLPDNFQQKELRIELVVIENDGFAKFYTPLFESSSDMILDVVRQNSFMAIIGIFLAMLGIVLLLFSVYTLFFNQDILQLLWIALLSLSTGIWVLLRYGILQLVSSNPEVNYYLEYLSLYIAVPFGLLSIYTVQDRRWKIDKFFKFLIAANILYTPIIILLDLLNVIYVAEALRVCHVFILVDSICIIYSCIKRRHIKTERMKLMGIFLFTLLSIADLIAFQLGNSANKGVAEARYSFAAIGAVVFIIVLLINYGVTSAHNFYIQAESTVLKKLAYADQLTGLANRTYTNERLIEFDANKREDYGMVLLDLNDLKKTNDIWGHSAGDELICRFADILKKCFEEIGSVARIGGDEFTILIANPVSEKIEEAISTMRRDIQKYNESQTTLNISAAWGIAYSWEVEECDTDKLYKLVDERMYARKREMKRTCSDEITSPLN